MLFENIYDDISSSKKEFLRQIAVSSLGLNLPLMVLFFYVEAQSYNVTLPGRYLILVLPLVNISYSTLLMFRGAHETIFLVSGQRMVLAGFVSLATDFMLRVFPCLGLMSYLLRISDGSIPPNHESLMYKGLSFCLLLIVFFYEVFWVCFFHHNESGFADPLKWADKWKKFLIKLGQSVGLSVSFLMVNIPILGMSRPKYRHVEHCIRLVISVTYALLFIRFDKYYDDTKLSVSSFCIVLPIHLIAYYNFEMAFVQHDDESILILTEQNRNRGSRFESLELSDIKNHYNKEDCEDSGEDSESSVQVVDGDDMKGIVRLGVMM